MAAKKNTFLDNLRQLTKLGNPKKQRKKEENKPGRRLAHRRSISVPNLTLVPGGAFSSEAIYFGVSPGVSDSDSITSCCNTDAGPNAETDRPSDWPPETGPRVPTCRTDAAVNKMSAPVGALAHAQDLRDGPMDSEDKVNPLPEALYAQVQKRGKEEVPRFTFDRVPAPRSIFPSMLLCSPKPEFEDGGRLCSEDTPANRGLVDGISAAMVRANFQGEQAYVPRRSSPCEQRQLCDKGTPPAMKKAPTERTLLTLDSVGTPLESADGTSLDSACGTPSEERVNLPWTTDSEDVDRDLFSPLFMKDLSAEEALLEQFQAEEATEDVEVSGANVGVTNANHSSVPPPSQAGYCVLGKIGSVA